LHSRSVAVSAGRGGGGEEEEEEAEAHHCSFQTEVLFVCWSLTVSFFSFFSLFFKSIKNVFKGLKIGL